MDQHANRHDSVYRRITEQIASAIAAGAPRYEMPWHRSGPTCARPVNVLTNNPYQGINVLALWVSAQSRSFSSGTWGTYRQWRTVGGQVRKGEKGSVIVFYKKVETTKPEDEASPDDKAETRLVARASIVFNAAQVDNWAPPKPAEERNLVDVLERVDQFIRSVGADIHEGGGIACYRPHADYIQMPRRSAFRGTSTSTPTESYYAVLLHEHVHWSGHKSRLNRDFSGRYGSEAYAMEELVAELGAAYLCADLGVANDPRPDHAAYVASWLRVLANDSRAIFNAAGKASAAASYLAEKANRVTNLEHS